ncbi:MAG: MFS transporter, partial [Acidimicrobiales bacterium]
MAAKSFFRVGHTPSLAAAFVHFDVSFMCWVLLGALGAYVASDLGLSAAQKGLMVAVPPLGGSAFRLLLGTLADRVGVRRTGLVTMGLTLVPLAWGWLAGGTYAQVLGIGLLLGVAGASFAVALPLASRWYPPEHQGLALGIAGAGNSGTLIAALAAPRLAEHVGWH